MDTETLYAYLLFEWPGPPTERQPITLPPAVTDERKLGQAGELYKQGKVAFDSEEWQQAIDLFDGALKLNPRHAEAYYYRGAARRHLGPYNVLDTRLENHELAILDSTRAIAADPTWWKPYRNRGYSYGVRAEVEPVRSDRRQWLELALADYTRAVELEGDRGESNCGRASIYANLGDRANVVREALLCPCDTTACLSVIQRAYRCVGDYAGALRVLQEWQSYDPEDPALYWNRGLVYISQGRYEDALREFDSAEERYEDGSTPGAISFDRAAAEYHLGHFDRAEELILQAGPYTWIHWGAPYYYLGMIWLRKGKVQEAVVALQWAELTLDEDDPLLAATRAELERIGP